MDNKIYVDALKTIRINNYEQLLLTTRILRSIYGSYGSGNKLKLNKLLLVINSSKIIVLSPHKSCTGYYYNGVYTKHMKNRKR